MQEDNSKSSDPEETTPKKTLPKNTPKFWTGPVRPAKALNVRQPLEANQLSKLQEDIGYMTADLSYQFRNFENEIEDSEFYFPQPYKKLLKMIDDRTKDYNYTCLVMGSILKCISKKERREAFNILWPGVIDKGKLTNKFVQDILVSTDHEEYCLSNVNRAKLLFRMTTFFALFGSYYCDCNFIWIGKYFYRSCPYMDRLWSFFGKHFI